MANLNQIPYLVFMSDFDSYFWTYFEISHHTLKDGKANQTDIKDNF